MEYNHEGEKYSTYQVEKLPSYPQFIHPKNEENTSLEPLIHSFHTPYYYC